MCPLCGDDLVLYCTPHAHDLKGNPSEIRPYMPAIYADDFIVVFQHFSVSDVRVKWPSERSEWLLDAAAAVSH